MDKCKNGIMLNFKGAYTAYKAIFECNVAWAKLYWKEYLIFSLVVYGASIIATKAYIKKNF